METKPTLEQAAARLRIDESVRADLADALDQAHDEALAYLDRPLYPDRDSRLAAIAQAQAALATAVGGDAIAEAGEALVLAKAGIVITHDLIAAQLLLADRLVGDNDASESEAKERAAHNLMRPRRRETV